MDIFTSLGILIPSMLILAFLQLSPGIFLIFSHYTSAKYSRRKASDLALFYILGVETFIAFIFIITYFLANSFLALSSELNNIITQILCGILILISILFFCLYFRKGSGTKLFISRKIAENLTKNCQNIKKRNDAFFLGLTSSIPELIFTFPIFLISSFEIMQISENFFFRALLILLFVFSALIPLFIIHFLMEGNKNLADLQKFRVKNKNFFRFFITLLYLVIIILIVNFRILL